jgi:hypothetical protein
MGSHASSLNQVLPFLYNRSPSFTIEYLHSFNMAPYLSLEYARSNLLTKDNVQLAKRAVVAGSLDMATRSAPVLMSRGLKVNGAQKVTLGVIALYVVVIAILWNLPFVRWSLWPFKVSLNALLLD